VTAHRVRRDWYPLIAGVLAVVVAEFVLILWTTSGHFTYTLDDPYIHLALAENLARFGHYGLNLEDYSSPSSSILWPLLLVPFLTLGAGLYAPLIVNTPCAIATVLVIHQLIVECAASDAKHGTKVPCVWALLIFFAANGFGLIFTGMEHSLQVLVTVSVLYLLIRMQLATDSGKELPSYNHYLLVLFVVLSPLVRFEGLAISAFAIAMLIRFRKPRLAIFSAGLIALSLVSYFHAMLALGLPWLPSSVLVKSAAAADVIAQTSITGKIAGAAARAASNVIGNLESAEARLLLVIGLLIAALSLRTWRRGERMRLTFAAGVVAVIGLHLAFGRFGWYGRYQAYVFVFAVCAIPCGFPGLLFGTTVKREGRMLFGVLAALTVTLLGLPQHLVPIITTPIAAANIYQQQRQMHEFVARYWKSPIAATDIGYVSFENDHYVLDLWGLGSEEARQLNQSGRRNVLPALAARHDVHLVMIADRLISDVLPAEWQKIAVLELASRRITAADAAVSFYVVGLDQAECSHVAEQLAEFKRTLAFPETLTVNAGNCDRSEITSGF